MQTTLPMRFPGLSVVSMIALVWPQLTGAFEGQIADELIRGTETNALLYTVGTNHLRIEVTGSTWPNPINIVEVKSGAVTLLFPHNRSFVRKQGSATVPVAPVGVPPTGSGEPGADPRLFFNPGPEVSGQRPKTAGETPALPSPPALPVPPDGLPPDIGPQPASGGVVPAMPAMPMMPMPSEKLGLQATTNTMTILGFPCVRYDVKQRGQTLEIWATDKLLPYQPYLRNQPSRFGPRMIEEQWPGLLTERKLFPLRASLRLDNGAEHFRFELKSVTPEKIIEAKLFQPPPDYHELDPLPF